MDVKVRNGLEVTVKEQQGWVRHDTGESEMERCDTRAKNLFGTLEPCVCDTHEKCAKDAVKALCAGKCACNK